MVHVQLRCVVWAGVAGLVMALVRVTSTLARDINTLALLPALSSAGLPTSDQPQTKPNPHTLQILPLPFFSEDCWSLSPVVSKGEKKFFFFTHQRFAYPWVG